MSSVLAQICDKKQEHVLERKSKTSLQALKDMCTQTAPPRGFIQALQAKDFPAIIAEVKKASPSKGVIRADFNPVEIATLYKDNGAACLSVLTDEPYFQGSDSIFEAVRAQIDLPMLRKDFMIDPYQIYESRALGADCILLIMAALEDEQAAELYSLARDLGMDVLIEVHDEQEAERALKLTPQMIGVNNRNLKTLEVDIQTSHKLAKSLPQSVMRVAESGLKDFQTLQDLQNAGYHSFLVGESLMKQDNIAQALRQLRGHA